MSLIHTLTKIHTYTGMMVIGSATAELKKLNSSVCLSIYLSI